MSPTNRTLNLSRHATVRKDSRRLPLAAIEAALKWGRWYYRYGARIYRLDRRSVAKARRKGFRVEQHEGTTVVMALNGTIQTVYRNRKGRRIYH